MSELTHVRLSLSAVALAGRIAALRDAVAAFAHDAGAGPKLVGHVKLAASEALTNAVVHAYVDAPEPGPVHAEAWVDGPTLYVAITDEGRGLQPRADSPGLGLGLPLLAQLADDFRVGAGADGGTRVLMYFTLDDPRSRLAA